MSYATLADMLLYFRADELAQRGAPEDHTVTAELLREAIEEPEMEPEDEVAKALDRIQAALDDATVEMNGYIALRYRLPLPDDALDRLRRPCADLARCYLFTEGMSDQQAEQCKKVRQWLHNISTGQAGLMGGASFSTVPILRV